LARTYRHLGLDQRRTLFRLVEARTPIGEIAQRLGRHPSTLYRELGRNRFRDGDRGFCGYFPLNAQDLARRRRQRRRKLAAAAATAEGPAAPRSRASAGSRTGRRRSRAGRASATGKRTC
jgi:IS30 family transposase